jgi:hypothetical protein
MSNFFEIVLGSLAGITIFYLVESLYYEAAALIRGKQYVKFLEGYEDDHWDD